MTFYSTGHINNGGDCSECEASGEKRIVLRPSRAHQQPIVHRGLILSGNDVVKHPEAREHLRQGYNDAICFEMETAGIMDEIPCLVVRGICDYADTHKQDGWQRYAAAVAAAYCKALLLNINKQDLKKTRTMEELIGGMKEIHAAQSAIQNIVTIIDQNLTLQGLQPVRNASFDSYSAEDEVECLPGTRVQVLQEVMNWGRSPSSKRIFWLNGMAGTGKSTISRTVAASFKKIDILGASFFFKRGEGDQGNAKRLFPTLAWQLAAKFPKMTPSINEAIKRDPDISTKSLKNQFNQLLLQPLHDLEAQIRQQLLIVIVIDALDECRGEDDIEGILRLLPQVKASKSIQLRFFLTSRPDLPTFLGFREVKEADRYDLILHEVSRPVIAHDIELFLKHKFSGIRSKRSISTEWPEPDDIQRLVTIAVPLFIFAATVCWFIEDLNWSPELRLKEFLADPATKSSEMDRTYLPILNQLLTGRNKAESDQLRREFREIIGVIICLASPLSVNALSSLIAKGENELDLRRIVKIRVELFRSVLSVPNNSDNPVRILHQSFRDYLVKTESDFHVDERETHRNIASCCLHVMDKNLKRNICGLSNYVMGHADINSEILQENLPPELQYSCRYWVYHLEQGKADISELMVLSTLKRHFLHWLEAMSLMGALSDTIGIIAALQSYVENHMDPELSGFLDDAKRFILKYVHISSIVPLQLYCTGLIFSPLKSIIRQSFDQDRFREFSILPQVERSWSAELQTLEGHSGPVRTVVFSPDGQTVASGSDDHTVKLWDIKTGTELHTLNGHTQPVRAVVFSPDGQTVGSGSSDCTIRVWDTKTGTELQTFTRHIDPVGAVVFSISPDGQTAASGSGSGDCTVKLWDIKTGMELYTLKGHSYPVQIVVFSPDNQTVASGSSDRTVKLWSTKNGMELHTLKGHSHPVRAVVFSPNSQMVVSSSDDRMVKLWDTKTGKKLRNLKGHSGSVQAVDLSPNGQIVASGSGSGDHTVKLWNIKTGGMESQTLKGHSGPVRTVVFSPNGQMVVSGSDDRMVKFWDTKIGMEPQTLEGHSGPVRTMVFSPDGHIVASGSGYGDHTVKLWDTKTGMELQTLKGHSGPVQAMAFSPDGQTVASGSDDHMVKLWDTNKVGTELRALKGHSGPVHAVAFSPDGQMVASGSGSSDRTIKLWEAKTGSELHTLKGHSGPVRTVVFSPDGQMVASSSGSSDRTVKLWDTKSGMELHNFKNHSGRVRTVGFSPDSQMVTIGSGDRTVKFWDTKTGKEHKTLYAKASNTYIGSPQRRLLSDTKSGHSDDQLIRKNYHQVPNVNKSQISVTGDWVVFGGEEVLWLPAKYREFSCSASKDNTLALGYPDGRVLFIGFSIFVD